MLHPAEIYILYFVNIYHTFEFLYSSIDVHGDKIVYKSTYGSHGLHRVYHTVESNKRISSILFLDIDGVLNTHESLRKDVTDPMDVSCLEQLERVIKATNCKIVITSTWRLFGRLYIERAIIRTLGRSSVPISEAIIGMTPQRDKAEEQRGDEIRAWLNSRKDRSISKIGRIAVVDDDADMKEFLPFLVKTDPEFGLTEGKADELIARLNRM